MANSIGQDSVRLFRILYISPTRITMIIIACSAIIIPSPVTGQNSNRGNQLIVDLKAAWDARQVKFRSAKMQWDESREYHPGSIIPKHVASQLGLPQRYTKQGWPLRKEQTKFPRELILQGVWMRHTSRSVGPSDDYNSLRLSEFISTYDGGSSRLMSMDSQGANGIIRKEAINTSAVEQSLRALMYFMRPFEVRYGLVDRNSLTIDQSSPEDTGVVIQANAMRRFWVDPKRDYIILAWEQMHPASGDVLQTGSIEYEWHNNLGWIPQGWEILHFYPDGRLRTKSTGSVTHLEAGAEYSKTLFQLKYPANAHVYDQATQQEFIAQSDGSLKPISPQRPDRANLRRNTFSVYATILIVSTGIFLLFLLTKRLFSGSSVR